MDNFKFKNPKLEYLVDKGMFRLLEDYVTPECTVPKGFVTNGASTGRFLQTLFPSYYTYFPAAIVHDYMYASGIVPKEEADRIFRYNIEIRLKMSAKYYIPMYYAVRWFGGSHYKQK